MLLKKICFTFILFAGCLSLHAQQYEIIKQQYLDGDEKLSRSKSAAYYMDLYRTGKTGFWDRKMYYNDTIEGIIASVGRCRDSVGQVKEGAFIYYHRTGAKKAEGLYINNLKEGEWKEWNEAGKPAAVNHYSKGKMTGRNVSWYDNGKISDSIILDNQGNGTAFIFYEDGTRHAEGNYAAGNKQGQWVYYYSNVQNKKSAEVIYDMDSVKTYTCFTEAGELQKKDCVFEREANFKGGDDGWIRYLVKKLTDKSGTYTNYLKQNEIYTVVVRFTINKDGGLEEARVEKKGIPQIDAIALDIIRSSPKWIPAVQYNRRVKAWRRQPITFRGPE